VKGYSFFLKVKRLQQNLHGVQKFPENQGKKGKRRIAARTLALHTD
jgi:hypothetical protein